MGKKYLAIFKKSWHCVFKKVRLQKCDTNFKDDVKNTILKKVILKKPKLVKPLSILIEIVSVLIVFITVWSLVIAIKSLLALWVFGTCNVSKPSACTLTSESCSIDADEPNNIFEQIGQSVGEWGQIFGGIPDRLKTWGNEDFTGIEVLPALSEEGSNDDAPAYDIMDPGCIVCANSFKNQLNDGFFKKHTTFLVVYPIQTPDGSYKFKNSRITAEYILSAEINASEKNYAKQIINKLFTEKDEKGVSFQTRLNNDWEEAEVIEIFSNWLKDFGATDEEVEEIKTDLSSDEVKAALAKNKEVVDEKIHAKAIPTLIYDGKKHSGLYKN
ncbi:hypothetical protein J6X90_00705 [Candidatus Saccharibacteria bacterium]|nr:hypothetical protein [Candidatus Saccharibacteria bacterium]